MPAPVMVDIQSTVLNDEERILLTHPQVGGLILFSRNYESPEQVRALCTSIRSVKPEILIAVDQEGGRVQRFQAGFTRLPAMQQFLPLYRKNSQAALKLVQDSAWLMASELLDVGIDFSFGPVLDIDDHKCSVIADRSFSPQASEVVALAGAWLKGMHEAGMATTGKHFPGHGGVSVDSHLQLPIDEREFTEIAERDLLPFAALLEQLDAIMPAHILFPKVDQHHSVGFSGYWLQTILREDMGFHGVIFSDDLSMEGAASVGSFTQRAELALKAGCDMVLVCNNQSAAREVLDSLNVQQLSPSNERLQAMRARKSVDGKELNQSSRWRLTQQLLRNLTG